MQILIITLFLMFPTYLYAAVKPVNLTPHLTIYNDSAILSFSGTIKKFPDFILLKNSTNNVVTLKFKNSNIFKKIKLPQPNSYIKNISNSKDGKSYFIELVSNDLIVNKQPGQNSIIIKKNVKDAASRAMGSITTANQVQNIIKPDVSTLPDGTIKWSWSWHDQVASAIFLRSNYLWIIFNKSVNVDLTSIKNNKPLVTNVEQIPNKLFTIVRATLQEASSVKTYKNNNSWIIELPAIGTKSNYIPKNSITQYNSPFSKGIFFPASNMSEPFLTIIDPEIGDIMNIVTFYKSDYGVPIHRKFIDFDLFSTSQGFVISLISDRANLTIITPGIEIVIPENHFTKSDATGYIKQVVTNYDQENTESKTYSIVSIIDDNSTDFIAKKTKINKSIMEASTHNKAATYFNLANFYYSNKFYAEGVAALNVVKNDPYSKTMNKEIQLLKSIGEFMSNHYQDAYSSIMEIDDNNLNERDKLEVNFWKNLMLVAETKNGNNVNYLEANKTFLKNYAKDIQFKIATISIEQGLFNDENLDDVRKIVKIVDDATTDQHIKNSMKFYKAELSKKIEDTDQALRLWRDVEKNNDDKMNSTRASFSEIEFLVDNKMIESKEAIDGLEKLRMAWRGDDIEAKILRKLGELYNNNGHYVEALRVWKILEENHQNSGEALFIAARMSNSFVDLFTKDSSDPSKNKLSDLESISLYYEFRELTPIGKMGDNIISQLADRMIKLDLLDKAATLYEHQIEYRLTGDEKFAAASKLALVYILDNKSDKALETLNKTNDPNMSINEQIIRNQLYAKALLDNNKPEEALRVIRDDFSNQANELKIEIFTRLQDWRTLQSILSVQLDAPLNAGTNLTQDEVQHLIKLAIADYMLEDKYALQNLLSTFKPLLSDKDPSLIVLDFLSQDEGPVDYKRLENSLEINSTETFLKNYKDSLLAPNSI